MTPAIRKQALAEFRGYREPRPIRAARPVSDLVGSAMRGLGLGDLVDEGQVAAAWREIVGDFIALHSAPARLTGGTLTIRVLQPSLRFELERQWRGVILEKLKARFGGRVVRKLEFRVG